MPSQTTPPVTIAKPHAGGVLPLSAVTDKHAPAVTPKNPPPQRATTQPRTKLVVRRLPPGITHAELDTALGDEWKAGQGKVNWADFRPGKISKECVSVLSSQIRLLTQPSKSASKPSRPARLYLQIPDPANAETLAQLVAKTSFADSRGSASDPVLIGPPVLEHALYGRVPTTKRRNDARQGTIDQDPEFIEFLESLTNPISKPKALEAAGATKDDSITVTPLIQHLRDKKAAKDKAASNKASKQQKQDSKDAAGEPKAERKRGGRDAAKGADKENRPAKANEKTAKEPAPKPTRAERAAARQQAASANSESSSSQAQTNPTTTAAGQPSSRRPENASAAAKLIQRDLGLQPEKRGSPRSGRGAKTVADTPAKTNESTATAGSAPASPKPGKEPTPKASSAQSASATKDSPSAKNPSSQAQGQGPKSAGGASQRQSNKVQPKSDQASTKAFLKHANPSQGITEAAIQQAMAAFGDVSFVDLDKRKGFAIVTFGTPASLQAAMAASPVTVAQGSVQILEWKQRGNTQSQANPPSGPAAMNGASGTNAPARGGRANGPRGGPRGRGRGSGQRAGGTASSSPQRAERANGAASDAKATAAAAPAPPAPTGTTNGAT